ncbi:MAG: hypothetical protein CGU28_16875 [Candidatus Dactylopiibacterium carminicum]|uniref:Uncharacterized protein n=1 Tax=Candidatus Dactylopiibacterium carminicum TaxID=857335 RepID=A0A272EMJ0_9RHOO|nr:hypothetical protein [Candidatus Dactylopiibacterium carminicum]KAF7597748.1 hypothetical protein BGI27_17110 [Candidatus Dactylopiibacterium carminicum]PAS91341.1 MAG: hypothetical protein CGU29_16960 [Candidatus Dactylopiibacterium carminicum]PAS92233.1 MAG: hypothetical protein CGU28_16875 [Candidatus Dactylopiibacterium carminicum]PAS95019.1 MAG: hypothetical protein BSR46_17150 [Candidatus Dactylopiibacterium carminicum]
MSQSEFLTQAEFARRQGWARSYVTELKRAGRLVMDADGKRVDLTASLALIRQTASPDKAAVAARHAEERGESRGESRPDDGEQDADPGKPEYQAARARREEANAGLA